MTSRRRTPVQYPLPTAAGSRAVPGGQVTGGVGPAVRARAPTYCAAEQSRATAQGHISHAAAPGTGCLLSRLSQLPPLPVRAAMRVGTTRATGVEPALIPLVRRPTDSCRDAPAARRSTRPCDVSGPALSSGDDGRDWPCACRVPSSCGGASMTWPFLSQRRFSRPSSTVAHQGSRGASAAADAPRNGQGPLRASACCWSRPAILARSSRLSMMPSMPGVAAPFIAR
jgi:hypothetical protein